MIMRIIFYVLVRFAKENIQPVNVMRLRDAAFCIEHRIPLFTEEAEHRALRNNEEYNRLADRYGTDRFVIRGGQAIFPTYTAVECGSDYFSFHQNKNRGCSFARLSPVSG